jgi:hypothetical protein
MTHSMIYPELQEKSNAAIQYVCSHSGGMYVRTDLTLSGRGIKMSGDGSDSKDGKKSYHVTAKAFEKLEAQFSTCYLASL